MKTFLLLHALWMQVPPDALTIEEAVRLATDRASTRQSKLNAEVEVLRRHRRYPSFRADGTLNSSRTLDIFSEGPLELNSATATVAIDWPIYDGGARAARLEALEARTSAPAGRSAAETIELVDAFAALFLAQSETALLADIEANSLWDADKVAKALEGGELSILEATELSETAYAFRARRLDVDARRAEAEFRLAQLIGRDASTVFVDPETTPQLPRPQAHAASELTASRARVREAEAARGPQVGVTAYGGVGAAQSTFRGLESDGGTGVYGARVLFTLPLFDWELRRQLAEARANEAEVERTVSAHDEERAERAGTLRRAADAAEARVSLLSESLEAARKRLESIQRLVAAGVRTQREEERAKLDVADREIALLRARLERWRFSAAAQLLGAAESAQR